PDVALGSKRLSSSKGQSHREVAAQRDSSGPGYLPRGLLCRRDETSEEPVRPATYGERSSHEVVLGPGLNENSVRHGSPCLSLRDSVTVWPYYSQLARTSKWQQWPDSSGGVLNSRTAPVNFVFTPSNQSPAPAGTFAVTWAGASACTGAGVTPAAGATEVGRSG